MKRNYQKPLAIFREFFFHLRPFLWLEPEKSNLKTWLIEKNSITQRLRRKRTEIKIDILYQHKSRIYPQEALLLKIDPSHWCWVREVEIFANDRSFIIARSVIPLEHFRKQQNPFLQLKNKPLGDWLFQKSKIKRSEFYYANIYAANHERVHGRCSLFKKKNHQLLLSEIFKADML